jgi:hypothetical protein
VERELRKYQEMKLKYDAIVSERKRKSELIREMKDKFSLTISRKEVAGKTVEQLKVRALEMINGKIKQEAAGKIGKAWRTKRWQREKRKSDAISDGAIRKIQAFWRRYIEKKRAVATTQLRTSAALIIQRQWRGYRDRKRVGDIRKEACMQANFRYFETMRETLTKAAAKVILDYWRKYKLIKANKRSFPASKPTALPAPRKSILITLSSTSPAVLSPPPSAIIPNSQPASPQPAFSLPETHTCQVYHSQQVFQDP